MWYNPIILFLLNSPLHGFISRSMMAVTLTGRVSGRRLRLPVSYLQEQGELLTLSPRRRVWWRNLRGGAPLDVRLRGEFHHAQGCVDEQPEAVAAGLARLLALEPRYARALGIRAGRNGQPEAEDLARAAGDYVLVRIRL